MTANIPEGYSLKIVLRGGVWGYAVGIQTPINWDATIFNWTEYSQEFTVTKSGEPNDLQIEFISGSLVIEYYENGATEPTLIRQLKIIDRVEE